MEVTVRRTQETKRVRRKKRRHILCACASLLAVITVLILIVLTTSGLLANARGDTNTISTATTTPSELQPLP
ncbi:hypothetical protein BaRGS_00002974 [Batillaria attramentaria]|uniref:Uncharacterized protein n=1 Tax=Batillaria attramentaria TaxID=370345 RepID=A0ABD0M1Z5_9CAEN